MRALLDINVLLARVDRHHVHHQRVTQWLASVRVEAWVTCPLTENGFLRIFSNPAYSTGPGSLSGAIHVLAQIRALPGHQFVPDDVSVMDLKRFPQLRTATPAQLTDLYLLGLAGQHHLTFVTLDGRVPAHLVVGGEAALLVVPGGN